MAVQQVEEQLSILIRMIEGQGQRQETLGEELKQQMHTLTLRVERQFAELETQHQELGDRVNTLEEDCGGLKEGVAVAGEQLAVTRGLLSTVEQHLASAEGRLAAAEGRMDHLEQECNESQLKQLEIVEELHGMVLDLGACRQPGEDALSVENLSVAETAQDNSSVWVPLPTSAPEGSPAGGQAVPSSTQPGRGPAGTTGCELRADARPFLPSHLAGQGVGGGTGGGQPAKHKPVAFDGRSSWEAYATQFDLLAELNHWTEEEKATYLAISLRGTALTVLTNLPEKQRRSYPALVQALRNRFGTGHQTELNRAKLRARVRRRDETLPALAEDVERLTRLAYPGAAEEMVATLSKDQFIDALHDEDTKLRVRQLRPQTLQRALEMTLELESYSMAGKQRGRVVRETRLENAPRSRAPASTGGVGQGKLLLKLQECLEALQGSTQRTPSTQGQGERAMGVTCWICRQKGHYRRDCPKSRARRGEAAPQGGSASNPTPQTMSGNGQ